VCQLPSVRGAADHRTSPFWSTAKHLAEVGQAISQIVEVATVCAVHVPARGLLDTKMRPEPSAAAQNDELGQETLQIARPESTSARFQAGIALVGSVDTRTPPSPSLAAQKLVDGQDRRVIQLCGSANVAFQVGLFAFADLVVNT